MEFNSYIFGVSLSAPKEGDSLSGVPTHDYIHVHLSPLTNLGPKGSSSSKLGVSL